MIKFFYSGQMMKSDSGSLGRGRARGADFLHGKAAAAKCNVDRSGFEQLSAFSATLVHAALCLRPDGATAEQDGDRCNNGDHPELSRARWLSRTWPLLGSSAPIRIALVSLELMYMVGHSRSNRAVCAILVCWISGTSKVKDVELA